MLSFEKILENMKHINTYLESAVVETDDESIVCITILI